MFQELNKGKLGKAINLDRRTKTVQGFLLTVKSKVGKFASSRIYTLSPDGKDTVEVWGNTKINQNLLDEKGKELDPRLKGVFVRLTYKGETKVKGRRQPMKDITVEADFGKKLGAKAGAKTYLLKG